jgi:hypothetical protein
VTYLNSYIPNNIDFNYLTLTSEKRIEIFEIIKAMPLFYKQVFTCFNTCKSINDKLNHVHFLKQPIWSNERLSYRGKSIFFPNWLKSNFLYVKDLFTNNGVLKQPEYIIGRGTQKKKKIHSFMLDFFSEGANCVGTRNDTMSWSYKRFMNTTFTSIVKQTAIGSIRKMTKKLSLRGHKTNQTLNANIRIFLVWRRNVWMFCIFFK